MIYLLSMLSTLSLRYWFRHRIRAALLVGCVALGVATWTATRSLEQSLERASTQASTPLGGYADFHISNGDLGVPRNWLTKLRSVRGVQRVRPVVIQRGLLTAPKSQPVLLVGIELPAPESDLSTWKIHLSPSTYQHCFAFWLLGQTPVVVGQHLAAQLPAGASSLRILLGGKKTSFKLAGTITAAAGPAAILTGNVLILRDEDLARLAGQPDMVQRLDVVLAPDADRAQLYGAIQAIVGDQAHVWTPQAHDERAADMLKAITLAIFLCSLGALVVGLFLIYNALAVSMAERRREIGILRSLGTSRSQLLLIFVAEASLLGITGSLLGLPFGYALARISFGPMQQIMSDVFQVLPETTLDFTSAIMASGVCAGLVTTLLGAMIPAAQASRVSPVEGMRRMIVCSRQKCCLRPLWVALALVIAGSLLYVGRTALMLRWASFASLGCFALAGFLLAPRLAHLLAYTIRPIPRRVAGFGSWLALDNLLRWPGRTGLVTAALASGVALLLQTSGVIRSNQQSIRRWVDQSVAGDLFVTSGGSLSASGKTQPMSEAVSGDIRKLCPQAQVVPLRFRYLDWRQERHADRILLVLIDASAYCAANEYRSKPLPDLDCYCLLKRCPQGALVSRNFAALHRLGKGDKLVLPAANGQIPFTIIGVVDDFSCPRGTVLIDRRRLGTSFEDNMSDVFSVFLPAGTDIEKTREAILQAPWAAEHSLCVATHSDVRGHILGMVGRLYGLAYAQECIVVLVSILGVVTVLLISVMQRRGELALLRALGATRLQVLWSVIAEALWMGVLGTVVGVVFGLFLEWFTIRVLLFQESGFLFPVMLPFTMVLVVVLVSLASAILAGLLPAFTAARRNMREALGDL